MSIRTLVVAASLPVLAGCNVLEVTNPARPSLTVLGAPVEAPGPAAPAPPAPAPPAPGRPCASASAEAVVACERGRYAFIGHDEVVTFLRDVARSLNEGGVAGGPFGVLRKTTGNNCGGFSCDIICAGQGDQQRQWDVLTDFEGAQVPGWAGPHGVPDIRVDECVIE